MNYADLESKTIAELYKIAKELELPGYYKLRKKELIFEIKKAQTEKHGLLFAKGVLEILPDGYGFLRPFQFLPSHDDIYVSSSQIRRFDLRTGDLVAGQVRRPKESERYFAMLRVEQVNGVDPESTDIRLHFDGLTPLYPLQRITLETDPEKLSTRIIDLIAPIGKGRARLDCRSAKASNNSQQRSGQQHYQESP